MTIFKKLALATAFAAFAATGAQAATLDTGFLLQNSTGNDPGVFTGTYPIASLGYDVNGNPVTSGTGFDLNGDPVGARVKGDSFIDEFILQINDQQDFSFYVASGSHIVKGKVITDVTFTSVSLTDLFGSTEFLPDDSDFELHSASADWFGLGSGTYDLIFTGTININGGEYSGQGGTIPSVPEPSGWALMFAGLAAMGTLARRRKN